MTARVVLVNGLIASWLVNYSLKIAIVASHIGSASYRTEDHARERREERERGGWRSRSFLRTGYGIVESCGQNSSQFPVTASVPLGTGVTGAIRCA